MTDGLRAELAAKGFARIPGVFGHTEVGVIRPAAYATAAKYEDRVQRVRYRGVERPSALYWPMDVNEALGSFVWDSKLQAIVADVLGPNVRIVSSQVHFRESGDGDERAWHQDAALREPRRDFDSPGDGFLHTMIVVDPMDDQNGAPEFIPGSHLWEHCLAVAALPHAFVRGVWEGEKVRANPGDVIIWMDLTIHASERNDSGRPRLTYQNGFAREDVVKNKARFPVYMKGGV